MRSEPISFIPYPPIQKLGVIGDRRTAALVCADGTIGWLCLPDYDGKSIFSSLLDEGRGGFWRLGPLRRMLGTQSYAGESSVLITRWVDPDSVLELTDAMLRPQNERSADTLNRRTIVRCLRCIKGKAACLMQISPRLDFSTEPEIKETNGGLMVSVGEHSLGLWTSFPVTVKDCEVGAAPILEEGEELWTVFGLNETPQDWSLARAQEIMSTTGNYWQEWLKNVTYTGPRKDQVRRSAQLVHLLSYAPTGALVAAPTTSLPERIGGSRNYDYRFAWIRDASLSLASLSLVGATKAATAYMDWLSGLDSSTEMPLQTLYWINGGTDVSQDERKDIYGYRNSLPVVSGNNAFKQRQFSSLGYLADCANIYLNQGGEWKPEYWEMMCRVADYTEANWGKTDNSIWELSVERHYVSSKVMSWCVFDRMVKIAQKLGKNERIDRWRKRRSPIGYRRKLSPCLRSISRKWLPGRSFGRPTTRKLKSMWDGARL